VAYQATVIPVMIASPGDVYEEKDVVKDVIHTWNILHSVSTRVILIPAGWGNACIP